MDGNTKALRKLKRRIRARSLPELAAVLGQVSPVSSHTELAANLVYASRLLPQVQALPFQNSPYVRVHRALLKAVERAHQDGDEQDDGD